MFKSGKYRYYSLFIVANKIKQFPMNSAERVLIVTKRLYCAQSEHTAMCDHA